MTLKEKLEEKVRKYLVNEGTPLVDGTICYTGIMEDTEMPNGQKLPMHMVRYQSWVVHGEKVHLNVIYIDPKSEKLVLKITPHMYEKINDDE
jgi:hypothetical protein